MNGRPMRRRFGDGIPKPKSIKELPSYLGKVTKGFLSRLFYIVRLVWESAPAVLIVMALLCVFDGVLPVVGAYISKDLLNEVAKLIGATAAGSVAENIFKVMRPALFLFVTYFSYLFLRRILSRINSMVTNIAGERVVNHIKLLIINKAKTVDLRSFDRPEFYEKLENANREAGMRPLHILNATFSVISTAISAVSFIGVLGTLSPWAPVIVIAASAPSAFASYYYRHKNFWYMRHHSKERREMNYYSGLMVNKDKAKEIKILGLSDTFIEKYKRVFARYYAGLKRLIVKEGIVQTLIGLFTTASNCALFIFVAYSIVFGNGEIGDYSLYTGALTSISGYVTTLLTSTASIYEGTLFINNMIEFMNEEVTVVPSVSEPLIPEKGVPHTIEFRNVSFRYPGADYDVISGLNLTMNHGESVVLVGLNGAGKTTLIKLLTRLYDPTDGVILLDGHDIKEYDVRALHDMFGIIFQDFGRYSETVTENIEFGDIYREHEQSEVVLAAERGSASEFIGKLPLGFDTPLTRVFEENGVELSGGQWQKLSVARAFYKSSEFLILDEPTASLDPLAEQEVFDQFRALSQDKITLFVSHRLSGAVSADKIIVLEYGKLVEMGTHNELMEKRGKYFTLFSTQAQRYTGIDYSAEDNAENEQRGRKKGEKNVELSEYGNEQVDIF